MIDKVVNFITAVFAVATFSAALFLLSTYLSSCATSTEVEPKCRIERDMFGHEVTACDLVKIRHKGEL